MKKTFTLKMLLILLCFTTANQIFSQKKQVKQTLFGKPINQKNINPENGYIRCASKEYEDYLQENNPKRLNKEQFEAWLEPIIEKQKQDAINGRTPQTVFNIPVVIHVIHNGDAINTVASHTGENISYAQAVSQITVMNQDYRRLVGTPGNGSTGYNLGVDCEVNFCLAQRDPFGNASDGVDRVNLGSASWSTAAINSTVKPQTQWDPTKYLNMWTVRFTDTRLLGYAQFPSAPTPPPPPDPLIPGLEGLSTNGGNSNTDGVVAGYDVFGTVAANDGSFILNSTYNLGRTMSHEVGHWIGLYHIWGDDAQCTGADTATGDYVADTPDSNIENYTCVVVQHCTGNDMVENYMDYTNDACMNTFTAGQKARMVAVMTNCVNRSTLSSSNGCTPGQVYGLDGTLSTVTATVVGCSTTYSAAVTLINRGTTTMTSAEITYNVDGGTNQTYNWTGSIATGASAIVTINGTTTSGAHNFNATLTKVNTVLDQNTTNNTFIKPFEIAPNHNATNVVFNFQKDLYARETTWNLKNSAGTILYSSVTYSNATGTTLPALLTQNWTLLTNDCYTFTINDSQSDGICCAWGIGYYNIKSSNGLVTLASGASFGASEVKSFGINLLENTDFETLNSIYVYPNPTKGILNISVPNDFGLPNNYTITNYLGQTVQQKVVSSENDLSINTSAFSKGVYFITVEKGNEKKTLRFVKE